MGRVNKKKMAELAEAAENDEQDKKSNASVLGSDEQQPNEKTAGNQSDDEDVDKDPIDSEKNNKSNDAGKSGGEDDDDDDEDDEEMHDALDTTKDDDKDASFDDLNDSNKSAKKRKATAASKKAGASNGDDAADDASVADSDDMPLNGAKKSRKAGATKGAKKAIPGGTKASKKPLTKAAKKATKKAESENEDEENDEKASNADGSEQNDDEGSDGDAEEEYEVQDIIDEKVKGGVTHYLIRWKGYTKDDDTWEPADTLSCPDIIERYNKKKAAGKVKGSKAAKKSKDKTKGSPKKGAGKKVSKEKADPDEEYEVEKIINYAEEKGERIFRIRWKGFKAAHDTWEPESNLNCKDLIKKFMERMKQNENLSFKELREEPKKTKRLVNETAPRTDLHNAVGRKSKRAGNKKRVYYGDSDE